MSVEEKEPFESVVTSILKEKELERQTFLSNMESCIKEKKSKIHKIIYPKSIKSKDLTIVIAHYNENLDWVQNLQYPYTIISRNGIPAETVPNKGNEASSFLEYIIEYYDELSEYTLFVHGHRTSWHHKSNIDERINKLVCDKPYYNINELETSRIKVTNNEYIKILDENCNIKYNIPNQRDHIYRAGAQFYVHKSLILRNPKSAYENFHKYLMDTTIGSFTSGRHFEYTWHIIFTHKNDDIE